MKRLYSQLCRHLLITLTFAFMAGICLYRIHPLPLLRGIQLSTILLVTTLYCHRQKKTGVHLWLILTFLFLGFTHTAYFTFLSQTDNHIRMQVQQETDAVLIGTLQKMILFDGEKSTLLIDSHHLRVRSDPSFSTIRGLVQLRIKGELPTEIRPGTELIIRCSLAPPYRYRTPGSFNYPAFLAAKNIHITGRIAIPAHIEILETPSSWLHTLHYLFENIRVRMQKSITQSVAPEYAGIYKALLIGDRSTIPTNTLEAFKAAGCLHILAISGLHMSILAATLFLLFYWLARRSEWFMLHFSAKKTALLATILPLTAYAFIAGGQTPVLRSLIMVLVFVLAFCSNQRQSPLTTLSFAALLILLLNPASLFMVSFQLSFAAVASLIIVLSKLKQLLATDENSATIRHGYFQKLLNWLRIAFLVSVAATLGTAPLLIYSFHRISTVGPFANLLIEPLLCFWSLPLGLIAALTSPFSTEAAQWLLQLGEYAIRAAVFIADFFASFEYSTLWFATPPLPLVIIYYMSILALLTDIAKKLTVPVFVMVCILFFFPVQRLTNKFVTGAELEFLDVGQGSSTFLLLPGGKTILIDGGNSSHKFNVGKQIIAPYLWQRGVTSLDAVIITHPDADHYNGIPFILQRFHPKTLWTNGESGHDQGYADLLNIANGLNITVKTPATGEIMEHSKGASLTSIGNPDMEGTQRSQPHRMDSNDTSMIIRFQGKGYSCLFPGDISKHIEQKLLQQKLETLLQTTFILAPHHGSKTSNSKAFLQAVSPGTIIVSAGRFHPHIFPSDKLQEYCQDENIPLLNTAALGSINIFQEENKTTITTFTNNRHFYSIPSRAR